MKLTNKTIQLVCEIENIIGNQCYNPNSYDGWNYEEGRWFRYPVCYTDKEKKEQKTRGTIKDINKKGIETIFYKFGSNQLMIGDAIVKVLELLEKKYNLNFDELVKLKKDNKQI